LTGAGCVVHPLAWQGRRMAASPGLVGVGYEGRYLAEFVDQMAQSARVAVLCFEADQDRCHRDVLLTRVAKAAAAGADK